MTATATSPKVEDCPVPKVDGKKYPYTPKGIAIAKKKKAQMKIKKGKKNK